MSVNTFPGRTILAKVATNIRSLAPLCFGCADRLQYNGFADAESLPHESKVEVANEAPSATQPVEGVRDSG
ncbi:unnamed protein product [Jaminaea pallidilutea]